MEQDQLMPYTLDSGVQRNREHPGTFEIPSDEDKSFVDPGDYVKLMFNGGDEGIERMWVKVTHTGDSLIGTLANNPFMLSDLGFGDRVEFQPEHIIDIMVEEAAS